MVRKPQCNCWWLKSCTTRDVWNPENYGINYQPQLVQDFSHQPKDPLSGRTVFHPMKSCLFQDKMLISRAISQSFDGVSSITAGIAGFQNKASKYYLREDRYVIPCSRMQKIHHQSEVPTLWFKSLLGSKKKVGPNFPAQKIVRVVRQETQMGVEPKIGGFPPKMDGENNGKSY